MVKLISPLALQSSNVPRLPLSYQLAIALISGMGMGLTPAPAHLWGLGWLALVPLWVLVLEGSNGRSPRFFNRSLLLGAAWGAGYHGLAVAWITGIHPMTWMGVPWLASLAIALFCWVFLTGWGAALVGAWAWLMSRFITPLTTPVPLRILLGTVLWCLLEALWSSGPLWWTSLSYTQSPYNLPILHLGQISGPLTVTAAIVACNGLLAEAWMLWRRQEVGRSRSLLAWNVALILVLHGLGGWLYLRPLQDQPDQAFKVGIIQGNIPNTIKLYEEGWRRALAGYTQGYETLADAGVQVVLTPETALPILWTGSGRTRSALYQAILEKGVPVWLGALGGDGYTVTNSLFTVLGDGTTFSEYRKAKLVPLGEYIPFQQWLGGVIDRLSPLDVHMIPGQPNQVFDTPVGRAIAAICYESAFASVFRYQAAMGGEFILTASNNAHYSPTMPAQHHAQDVMRAIETDRWAVRATNTGYSAIVDPHGHARWISGINTYEIHADTVYRRKSQTLYVRWGDWLTPLLTAIAFIAYGLTRFQASRPARLQRIDR